MGQIRESMCTESAFINPRSCAHALVFAHTHMHTNAHTHTGYLNSLGNGGGGGNRRRLAAGARSLLANADSISEGLDSLMNILQLQVCFFKYLALKSV